MLRKFRDDLHLPMVLIQWWECFTNFPMTRTQSWERFTNFPMTRTLWWKCLKNFPVMGKFKTFPDDPHLVVSTL